jgi:mannosyltransferase OCH1-like enzyme
MNDGAKNKKSINKVLMNKTPMNRTMIVGLIILIVIIIIAIIMVIISIRMLSRREEHKEPDVSKETIHAIMTRPALSSDLKKQKIPRLIMQTNESSVIPIEMAKAIQTILDLNPEYSYYYFDDKRAEEFIKKEYGSRVLACYYDLIPGAYRADLFRYCYIYKYGGIYIDTGMVCMNRFKELIKEDDEFIAPEDDGTGYLYNAFMCCVPGHPIIGRAIVLCVENIERRDLCYDMLSITGPGVLAKAFEGVMKKKIKPNKHYDDNIRIIRHISGRKLQKDPHNVVGEIDQHGGLFMKTKYSTYYIDRTWYHTKEHYGVLYKRGEVFYSKIKGESKDKCPDRFPLSDEEKILVNAILHRFPIETKHNYKQKIPKIIIQTDSEIQQPDRMFAAIKTILEKNPEYEYIYYDNKSAREFLIREYGKEIIQAYDRYIPGACKADLFRYCFLYRYGGVYLDSGMVCLNSLRNLIDPNDEFIAPEDDGIGGIYNAFMCSIPGHPLLKASIDELLKNVRNRFYGKTSLDIGGPLMMGQVFKTLYGEKPKRNTIYKGNNKEKDIKIIEHRNIGNTNNDPCTGSGEIYYQEQIIFNTKYPFYYRDMFWYRNNSSNGITTSYDLLWHCRQTYDIRKY